METWQCAGASSAFSCAFCAVGCHRRLFAAGSGDPVPLSFSELQAAFDATYMYHICIYIDIYTIIYV